MTTTQDIIPQASAHIVQLDVDNAELEVKCNQYWNEVKDRLNPDIVKKATRGGYRDVKREKVEKAAGGKSEFYRPVLIKCVSDYLDTRSRQAIAYNEVTLQSGIQLDTIKASVYLEPEVTWKKKPGVDQPFKIKLPRLSPTLLDDVVAGELNRLQQSNVILVPEPDGTHTSQGHVVALDCQTLVDGAVWAPGTFINNKWLLDESVFKVKAMMQPIVGLTIGESKTFDVQLPDGIEGVGGKIAQATVRINQIYKRDMPNIDDDLAITLGKANLEALKSELYTKYGNTLKEERDNIIILNAVGQLLDTDTLEISPIPQAWMTAKAHTVYSQHRDMHRTEEELLAKFAGVETLSGRKVISKNDLLAYFGERAAQSLISDLVLRSWGMMKGVQGDVRLSHIDEYVDVVRKTILESVEIEEYDTTGGQSAAI